MGRGLSFLVGAVAGLAAARALQPVVERRRREPDRRGPHRGAVASAYAPCPECGAPDSTPLDGGVLYRHVGGEESESRTVYWVLLQCRECRAEWHEEIVEREEPTRA